MVGAHRGRSHSRIEGKTPGADGAGLPVMREKVGVVQMIVTTVKIRQAEKNNGILLDGKDAPPLLYFNEMLLML
jgi:hypothetical protein